MKKVLLFILFMGFLFCITGCGEEDPMDDPFIQELDNYSFKDHLQCTKSEGKISYKIDVFQDPETYEVVFGTLTETYDIYPYDKQGKFTGFDPEKEYCSDYEKDTFSKCKADMFNVGGGALLFELSPKRAVINEEYPSKELIKDTIRKYIPDMSEETVNRRASTIRGWIQWIIGAQI